MNIRVTKASGKIEDFKPEKLIASLMRAGASKALAEQVIEKVLVEIEPYTSTNKIYRTAKKYLKRLNHSTGLKYSLKKALLRLGPTGYPFEKYYGELLKNYGYNVKVGVRIDGKCIKHEVDVLATKDNEVSVIECKYHNTVGKATDVKVAMYVHSRFRDIRSVFASQYPHKAFSGSLVTNTRCTSEALQYAQCSGFNVVSWKHPKEGSLEKMIEDKLLYPVTVVSGIQAGLVKKLVDRNIILLKDLVAMDKEEIQLVLSLPEKKARTLKNQADELCGC